MNPWRPAVWSYERSKSGKSHKLFIGKLLLMTARATVMEQIMKITECTDPKDVPAEFVAHYLESHVA